MALTTTKNISLDFYNNNLVTINAKQSDTAARYVNITCTDYGKKAVLDPDTMSAFVRYKKSDGHKVFNDATILNDGTIQIQLTSQMLASPGKQVIDLVIVSTPGLTAEELQYELVETYVEDVKIARRDGSGSSAKYSTFKYADKISTFDGKISLVDPTTVEKPSQSNIKEVILGKYIYTSYSSPYYFKIPSTADINHVTASSPVSYETVTATEAYALTINDRSESIYELGVSVISTMTFFINVISSTVDDTSVISTDEFAALTNALVRLNTTERTLKDLENTVSSNEEIRESNEETRQSTYNANKQTLIDCEAATEEANAAAEDARNAIADMETYTTAATEAADRANLAADKCEDIVDSSGVIPRTEKGTADGVATLDENSKIPVEQINTTFSSQNSEVITSGESFNVILGKTAAYMKAVDKMTQGSSTSNTNFPIFIAKSSSPSSGDFTGTYYNTGITANPSTKTIKATNVTASTQITIGDAVLLFETVNGEKTLTISFDGQTDNSSDSSDDSNNSGESDGGSDSGDSDNTGDTTNEYEIVETYIDKETRIARRDGNSTSGTWTGFSYADSITVTSEGNLSLINPITIDIPSKSNLEGVIEGKYIRVTSGSATHYYRVPTSVTLRSVSASSPVAYINVYASELYELSAQVKS